MCHAATLRPLLIALSLVLSCSGTPTTDASDAGSPSDGGGGSGGGSAGASDSGTGGGGSLGGGGGSLGGGGGSLGGSGGSVGGGGGAAGFRDWNAFPAIVQLDTTSDVFVIGDAHGDPDRLEGVLKGAGLISVIPATPSQVQWSGGTAVVIFMGDLIDKWTNSLGVLALVRTLEVQAAAAGGHVIVLLGNHEAEFLSDPAGTKTADFAAELTAAGMAPADVAAGTNPLGRELRSRPLAARVNDFFFSHAGDPGGRTLAQLDLALRQGLDAQGFSAPILMDPDSLLEARLSPAPWWEAVVPSSVVSTLGAGIAHVVEGHQPSSVTFSDGSTRGNGELYCRLGLFFLVDSGMSRGVNKSVGAALKIHKLSNSTRTESVAPNGASTLVWQG